MKNMGRSKVPEMTKFLEKRLRSCKFCRKRLGLLKRQIIGIRHWVSTKHLQRYVGRTGFILRPEASPLRLSGRQSGAGLLR